MRDCQDVRLRSVPETVTPPRVEGPAEIVVVPWYARQDFDWIWSLLHPGNVATAGRYEAWQASASRAVAHACGAGLSVERLDIRYRELVGWLARHDLRNDAAAYRRFLVELAGARLSAAV